MSWDISFDAKVHFKTSDIQEYTHIFLKWKYKCLLIIINCWLWNITDLLKKWYYDKWPDKHCKNEYSDKSAGRHPLGLARDWLKPGPGLQKNLSTGSFYSLVFCGSYAGFNNLFVLQQVCVSGFSSCHTTVHWDINFTSNARILKTTITTTKWPNRLWLGIAMIGFYANLILIF